MIKNRILGLFFVVTLINIQSFSQTLDQQLRQAQTTGQISAEEAKNLANANALSSANAKQFFKTAPNGISSLFSVPELIEEVKMGYLSVFYPKGYGKNVLHYGIWNAIPFVVFDNNTLELRFGLIFEHRQVGFVPDDWVSTSITGIDLPEINFLIPNSKTFLSFSNGSSQWRSTVLLTDMQLKNLELYTKDTGSTDPMADVFTVNHRFVDSSSRPYLIGLRHRAFFTIMLQMYQHISKTPEVKTFKGSDEFPAGAFFDELKIENVVTEEIEVTEAYEYEDGEEYEYDITTEYVEGEEIIEEGGYVEGDEAVAEEGGYAEGDEAVADEGAEAVIEEGGYDEGTEEGGYVEEEIIE